MYKNKKWTQSSVISHNDMNRIEDGIKEAHDEMRNFVTIDQMKLYVDKKVEDSAFYSAFAPKDYSTERIEDLEKQIEELKEQIKQLTNKPSRRRKTDDKE